MARARGIKPGLFSNELLGALDTRAMLLFIALWCLADREGRLEFRPARIRAFAFPYSSGVDVEALLSALEAQREPDGTPAFLVRYAVEGRRYLSIVNFLRHQRPHDNETPSQIPAPPEFTPKVQSACDLGDKGFPLIPSSLGTSSLGTSSQKKGASRSVFTPPTVEEVAEHVKAKGYTFDPETFVAHYESVGWRVGRNPMRSWRAALTSWHKRQLEKAAQPKKGAPGQRAGGDETRRAQVGALEVREV